jgi:hypothetical protein
MMLDRRQFVQRLLIDRGDLLIVPGLGSATYDVAAAGDHPLNFYLWGAMGGTTMIALGTLLHSGEGPILVNVKIKPDDVPRVLPLRDGHAIKQRFIAALNGAALNGV